MKYTYRGTDIVVESSQALDSTMFIPCEDSAPEERDHVPQEPEKQPPKERGKKK